MKTDIEHFIYDQDNKLLIFFEGSEWYDTATPAKYCISRLTELYNMVKAGQKLTIKSNGRKIEIATTTDFYNWLKNDFKGGFEGIFKNE
jgi:hypothetical protein